jgi:hypothetical protein
VPCRYCRELAIFDSEREDGMYDVGPWLVSETIAYIPLNVVFSALFAVVFYLMSGMRLDMRTCARARRAAEPQSRRAAEPCAECGCWVC